MPRSGAITFKGTPLTLAGNEVKEGQAAPDFKIHYFEGGMKTITLAGGGLARSCAAKAAISDS